MITNFRYADDIILLANSEAELQELVDHLELASRKYSLLINVDKIKVMASDRIACRILIIPAKAFARDYVITSVCLSVCYHDN